MLLSASGTCFFPQLLANRNGKPAALMLNFPSAAADAFLPFVSQADFGALTERVPCLIDEAAVPAALHQALLAAGCQPVDAAAVQLCTDKFATPLPDTVRWVAGDWYLANSARPPGEQGTTRALALQLVQLVATDADTREIEAVFRRAPTLSYHLLRIVNSVAVAPGQRITSFAQAIYILGRQQLRRWLNLLLFSAVDSAPHSAMLLARVSVRARLMELLARARGLDKASQELAFMAGMFSLLGVLFGLPLPEVLKPLRLSPALEGAVLSREGELGQLLELTEAVEHGDDPATARLLDALRLSAADFNPLALQAHLWMLDAISGEQPS